MLRNIMIMAASGLVLFSKDFGPNTAQPRLVGALITAMTEFSIHTAGMPVCYIELQNVSVTIVVNEGAKIYCALFHDKEDGRPLAKLLATELLHSFIDEYQADLGSQGHNLKDFHGFQNKVADVIKNSVRPIIAQLQSHRGITKALLVSGDLVTHTTAEIDQLGVLANLRALMNLSMDVMEAVGNTCTEMSLMPSAETRILLRPVGRSVLIVSMRKSGHGINKYKEHINDTTTMLDKVWAMSAALQAVQR